jgi:hypothetical protein
MGDNASVVLRNHSEFIGEIVAVSDSTVLFNTQPELQSPQGSFQQRFVVVQVDDLESITIKGYSNRKWTGAVIGFEVVPAILLGLAAGIADSDITGEVFLISAIPPLLNFIAFEASTPKPPKFEYPITAERLKDLKKYARFPQGLTTEQHKRFLQIGNSPINSINIDIDKNLEKGAVEQWLIF